MLPTLTPPRFVADDTCALTTHLDVPGLGVLPVNAFLVHAGEPVLVDTGIPALADDFVEALAQRIDLEDLRWIWLTHADPDHVGALASLLRLAPRARVVTSFVGMGKVNMIAPILPPERVWLIRPGQTLDVGGRELVALRPPTFDAPETLGLFDPHSRAVFGADTFGALLPRPADDARDVTAADLRTGAITWATIDNPWIHTTERSALASRVAELVELRPTRYLGAHLPPAPGELIATLGRHLLEAREATPFAGPDQRDLLAMLAA